MITLLFEWCYPGVVMVLEKMDPSGDTVINLIIAQFY